MGALAKLALIIFLLVLVFVVGLGTLLRVVLGIFSGLRPNKNRGSERRPSSRYRFRNEEKTERMLACSVCGVHVPESEGIMAADKFYCCEAHRNK